MYGERATGNAVARSPSIPPDPSLVPVDITLYPTSNVFKKGHRIRLEISSSNFPRFDRNPNTGHDLFADAEMRPAMQTVMHDRTSASYLTLPLIPSNR